MKQFTECPDTGCKLHPACLECPEPQCVLDTKRVDVRTVRRRERQTRVRELAAHGCSIRDIAHKLRLTERSINRLRNAP